MKLTGAKVKLKNRRVFLGRWENGMYAIEFKNLDREAPKGNRVRETRLSLSPEAMDTLVQLYFHERGGL